MSSCALFAQAYTGLRTLYLECNAIADMEGLDALVNLRCLYLGKNMIHEITGLDSLKQLETLDLSENDIRHVEGLGHLTKLKFLSLSGAQKLHLAHSCCVSTCLVVQYSTNRSQPFCNLQIPINLSIQQMLPLWHHVHPA